MNIECSEDHKYTIDGKPALGLTQILQLCGIIDYSDVPKLKLERSQKFGTAVHRACELYITGSLNEKKLDKALKPYLDAFKLFLEQSKFKMLYSEKMVASQLLRVACRVDLVGEYLGKIIVVEIKTPVEIKASAEIQTAGQKYLWNSNPDLPKIEERYILRLREDSKYRFDRCKSPTDEALFVSAYSIVSWRIQRKLLEI